MKALSKTNTMIGTQTTVMNFGVRKLRVLLSVVMTVNGSNENGKKKLSQSFKSSQKGILQGNRKQGSDRSKNTLKRIKINITHNNEEYGHKIDQITSVLKTENKVLDAKMILAIGETIRNSGLFSRIEREFEEKKRPEDYYYNNLLLIFLAKKELFARKYTTDVENGLDMYNTAARLKFTFKVTKIHTTTMDDVEKLTQLLKKQQSSDFDVDKFSAEVESLMGKFDKKEIYMSYDEMNDFTNIGHVKIPTEYREAQQLLRNYKYFIFARDKNINGTYVYYIITGLQEGKEVDLTEFTRLEENRLFYQWIIDILKKNHVCIEGEHIMNFIDEAIAKSIFKGE